jgi:23S rRNA-/tRNA-specific pseudouridylate synthase
VSIGSPLLLAVRAGLWVVHKPPGYLSHPGTGDHPDIVRWAVESQGAPESFAPIHRLDRLTSGLVLCSPDAQVRRVFGIAFAERRVTKIYRARVYGHTAPSGTIDAALDDTRAGRPLDAVSHFETLEQSADGQPVTSLLELRPETGRKHQLRKHLNLIGHPIVGDRVWRPSKKQRLRPAPTRLWLHAATLVLPDGQTYKAALPAWLEARPCD